MRHIHLIDAGGCGSGWDGGDDDPICKADEFLLDCCDGDDSDKLVVRGEGDTDLRKVAVGVVEE